MITINIGTNKYDIASEWTEVTLKMYADILRINNTKPTSMYIRGLEIIAALLIEGESNQFYDDMFSNLYEHEVNQIADYVSFVSDDIKKHFNKKNANEIEIIDEKGKWGIVTEFMGLKGAERVTLELELQEDNKQYDPIELAFGILCRQKNEDGTLKNFDKGNFKHILNHLTSKVAIVDIMGHIAFFLNSGGTSMKEDTSRFSIQTTQKKIQKALPKKRKKK